MPLYFLCKRAGHPSVSRWFFLLFFAKDIEKVLENYINIRQIRSIKCSIPFFSKFLLFQKLFFRGYFSMILPVRGATVATSVD